MVDALTGPALAGTEERWSDYPREDLYQWIRASQAMISEGHPRAVELWNEWKPTVMNNFPNLTDDDIESLLLYINGVADGTYGPKPAATPAGADPSGEGPGTNPLLYIGLFAVLAILALVLGRVISNLNYLSELRDGNTGARRTTMREMLTSKGLIGFVIFALIVLGGYTTVNKAIDLGRQQGYAPEQPIKFSHETHAGLHKIDCQYCHDGARRSKHSIIPATNTCMNCHKAIKYGSTYGTAEISKIYASIGFDPNKDQYIQNYDDMPQDSIKAIFTKWIGDQYVAKSDAGILDSEGQSLVEDQWEDIVSSLTNETKKQVQGPIEWTRIHNLPDHVYFNHAQHVTVGELECQQCHGKVEEMEVLTQYSPLSMGWCINCHRQTEVKFDGNEYYNSYKKYHDELASGKKDKVTVEDIGGLECQKCHY